MQFLKKLLHLPGPKELGRSACDALPSRDMTPDCEGYTWENWHDEVREKHPVRYFISETAADFIKFNLWYPVYNPIKNAHYWIVSHTIRRYHILDLRQPKNPHSSWSYRYGWCDVSEKLLYAIFNLLDQFVKNELPNLYCPSEEEAAKDAGMKSQRDLYFEILAIHKWWFEDSKIEYKAFEDCRSRWCDVRKSKSAETEDLWKLMREMEDEYERKTDEMIGRLMKIRRNLWT
jgi:hypothetical protein